MKKLQISFLFLCNCFINSYAQDRVSHQEDQQVDSPNEKTELVSGKKEILFFHLSYSPVYFLRMVTENEGAKVYYGFYGASYGLSYHYSKNRFMYLSIEAGVHALLPSVFVFGKDGVMAGSGSVILSNNHKIERLTIGYGLSYTNYIWQKGVLLIPTTTEESNAFGLVFPTNFQISKRLNLGISYRPTFYKPNMTNKFTYEHSLNIGFTFKIRLV